MSGQKLKVSKKPSLIATTPSDNSYKNLSQSQLLTKVKLLHEQVLKTNKYLQDVHRMSIYNWDEGDTGNIIVELPENKKGFLLDSVVRLRGVWDPATNIPELLAEDTTRVGWMYKVKTTAPILLFGTSWKTGDYALYDEEGILYNVQTSMLDSIFTPLILIESDTIQFDTLPQETTGIQVRANVKIDPEGENDLQVSARGLFSNAYEKAKQLITIQHTVPTGPNLEGGLRIVYLETPPETFYDGWLYLVPPESEEISN